VEVLVALHEKDGKTYGLRSSMVGDIFTIEDRIYAVDMVGFEQVVV
jgi:hypothetical protein